MSSWSLSKRSVHVDGDVFCVEGSGGRRREVEGPGKAVEGVGRSV